MIHRFQLLRNIGQFDSATSNLQIARLTLVYAENGRGKTTLAAILRSLGTGDPIPIVERRRLAAQHPPHVVLECTGGPPPATFMNGVWNRTLQNIAIFDDVFVGENVYSGLVVGTEHRQNLHELILGKQGVALNQTVQQLVGRIEAHNSELRLRAAAIPAAERGPFGVDQFCELPARPDIDEAIRATEQSLAAAREQNQVRGGFPFDRVSLPSFDPQALTVLLGQDLPGLDAAAEAAVRAHLVGLGVGSEAWASEGMRLLDHAPNACPFCAQGLGGSPVIAHYREYFGAAYAQLKRNLGVALANIERTHGGNVLAAFERAIRVTVERREFWSRFCEIPAIAVDTAEVARRWQDARTAVATALIAKQGAPLEPFVLPPEATRAIDAYEGERQRLIAIDEILGRANETIRITKERAATADPLVVAADLARLRATRARHTPAMTALCNRYVTERAAKAITEQQRDAARTALEQYRATVFPGYQAAVNVYLQRFNAGFRLDHVTSTFTRGGPTCTYNVVINNAAVRVAGGAVTGEPSFRTTLSAGDRNALALAFFFASLDQDPALADKIVIIDDPVSSLDAHRSLTTVQEMRRLARQAAQVIILSHSKHFLCRIWEGADRATRAALQVNRDGLGSAIDLWNPDEDSITEHDRRHALLKRHLVNNDPNARNVAEAIRPVLEAFLRVAHPDAFPPGTLLGPFQNLCTQRVGTPGEILNPAKLQELEDLIEFANRYHHDTNPAYEVEIINDAELVGFVRRTLAFAK